MIRTRLCVSLKRHHSMAGKCLRLTNEPRRRTIHPVRTLLTHSSSESPDSHSKELPVHDPTLWMQGKEIFLAVKNSRGSMSDDMVQSTLRWIEGWAATMQLHTSRAETKIVLNHDTVQVFLNHWYKAWRESNDRSRLPSPVELLDWIDVLVHSSEIRPNVDFFRSLMDASLVDFPEDAGLTAVQFIESLFQRMLLHLEDTPDQNSLTRDDFHRVMHAHIYLERDVPVAERYLQELVWLFKSSGQERLRPSNRTYNLVLAGYAKQDDPRRAHFILNQMLHDGFVKPEASNFETCMNSWIRSRQEAAGQRAEGLLLQMQDLYFRGVLESKTSARNVVKAITAWSESKRLDAADRAEAVLRLVEDLEWTPKDLVDGYLSLMRMRARSKDEAAPEKCRALFEELIGKVGLENIPAASLRKLVAFLVMACARTRRRDSAKNAQAAFDWISKKCEEQGVLFRPDRFCYNSLLEGWASVGNGHRANEVCEDMVRRFQVGDDSCKPDTKSLNSVLLAWSRSGDEHAAEYAEATRQKMLSHRHLALQPDVVTCNTMISIYSKSKDVKMARRGESFLRDLKSRYGRGDRSCRPTHVTYRNAMELWRHIKSPLAVERAEALMQEMTDFSIADDKAITTYLSILEDSGVKENIEKARTKRISFGR